MREEGEVKGVEKQCVYVQTLWEELKWLAECLVQSVVKTAKIRAVEQR